MYVGFLRSLNSRHILARSRIDADLVADVDEQRNLYRRARFERRGLVAGLGRIALNSGLRFRYGKLHEVRGIDAERNILIGLDGNHHFGNDVFKSVAAIVYIDAYLIERLGIHEIAEIVIRIEELIGLGVYPCIEKFLRRAERFFENLSRNDVLVFRSDERRTLTRLDVLEVHNTEHLAVLFKRSAFSEIACYHKNLLVNYSLYCPLGRHARGALISSLFI